MRRRPRREKKGGRGRERDEPQTMRERHGTADVHSHSRSCFECKSRRISPRIICKCASPRYIPRAKLIAREREEKRHEFLRNATRCNNGDSGGSGSASSSKTSIVASANEKGDSGRASTNWYSHADLERDRGRHARRRTKCALTLHPRKRRGAFQINTKSGVSSTDIWHTIDSIIIIILMISVYSTFDEYTLNN